MSHDLGSRARDAMKRAHDTYERIWHPFSQRHGKTFANSQVAARVRRAGGAVVDLKSGDPVRSSGVAHAPLELSERGGGS